MNCNICGCEEFVDMNARKAVRCRSCGSLERTRLFYMYIDLLNIKEGSKILHIAPEEGLYNKLRNLAGEGYVTADYDPKRYSFADNCLKIDLTSMEGWEEQQFDYIFHIHVMEHIPCNIAYPIYHLHRILKVEGIHMCIMPFMNGGYEECFEDLGDAERTKRFGQYDHVRRFGKEDIEMHLGKVLSLPKHFDARDDFSEYQLREANIPQSHWSGFHIGTVLRLKRSDYKLSF